MRRRAPLTFHESFRLEIPQGAPPKTGSAARDRLIVFLPKGVRADCAGQLVGDVHHRLHDPDRAAGRPLHVPVPQGEGRRGVDIGRHRRAGGDGGGGLGLAIAVCPLFRALTRRDHRRDRRLRLRRVGPARLAAALPPRLPIELPQNRHHRPAGRRGDPGESDTEGARDQPDVRLGRRPRISMARSSRSCSSASCAARSPASTPSSPPGRPRR